MRLFSIALAVVATVRLAGLTESSGLASSHRNPGVFWTMNDGPNSMLFAFDRKGVSRARVRIRNAKIQDWEGLSLGPGPVKGRSYLYLGDIGDNRKGRKSIIVYRFEEPELKATATKPAEIIRLTYPDGPHDAEALMVHPGTGDLYVVIKSTERDTVYKASAPLSTKSMNHLKRMADLRLPPGSFLTQFVGRITGGDISPDGARVVLCDYSRGWEALVPKNAAFDEVWDAEWRPVDLGQRPQGEAVAYSNDGRSIVATSEGAEFPLIESPISK